MDQQVQKKKRKKGLVQKIGEKLGKGPTADELAKETLSELTDIVGSMKDIFKEFEDGYFEQLTEERTSWDKVQAKLPSFLQKGKIKVEEKRMDRIKSNKSNLSELEDNLRKLDLVLSSSSASFESLGEAYIRTAIPGQANEETIKELEKKMETMQENISDAMGDLTAQISLIKSALDNMAGQLDEQGVALEGIDKKIDQIDGKLDRAHEMLKKISRQLTGNRIMMLVVAGTATAIILNKLVL
ncbi:MAG: hypothetical protein ACXAC2_01305 [Candidatus Kariarchaeaceae archaeon]